MILSFLSNRKGFRVCPLYASHLSYHICHAASRNNSTEKITSIYLFKLYSVTKNLSVFEFANFKLNHKRITIGILSV